MLTMKNVLKADHFLRQKGILFTCKRLTSLMEVVFLLFLVLVFPARAGYNIKQITNNSNTYNVRLNSSGMVVWQQMVSLNPLIHQIFLYKNGNITQVSTSSYGGFLPGINDLGQVTWWGFDGSSYQVYLYTNGTIKPISSNNNGNRIQSTWASSDYPNINKKGQIAWIGSDGLSNQVFIYAADTVYKISHNNQDGQPRNNYLVDMNAAGQVVWQGDTTAQTDPNAQVMFYNNGSTTQLSYPGTTDAGRPRINNNEKIVWEATNSAKYYLYFYNNGNISQFIQEIYGSMDYDIIDTGDILFSGDDGAGYRYSNGVVSRISNSFNNVGNIIAKGNQSVFHATDQAKKEWLCAFNGTVKKVSTYSSQDYDINTEGQVAWAGGGIFLATPGIASPEISLLLLN